MTIKITIITRTKQEIALMQEYRTRLAADILTSKIDVPKAAAGACECSRGLLNRRGFK